MCARQRTPWRSSSAIVDKVHPSTSFIHTAVAFPQSLGRRHRRLQAAQPISSSGIEAAHRSMAIVMGRTHRAVAAASSRRLLVMRLSVVPRLVPGSDGGGGRETKRGGGDRGAPLRSPYGGCGTWFVVLPVVMLMTDYSSRSSTVTISCFYLGKRSFIPFLSA